MKKTKFVQYIAFLVVTMLFAGCTLVMDEEIANKVTPSAEELENVGFDEPYTKTTDFGDITYQYSDSTRVFRKAMFDYLIQSEGDSVFWFTDNIPTELLIYPGYYVSMMCCEEIPFGLCNQVLSLTHENGMYKMVTTRVEQERVFDQLEYTIEYDYQSIRDNAELLDSQQSRAYGFSDKEIVMLDRSTLCSNQTRGFGREASITPSNSTNMWATPATRAPLFSKGSDEGDDIGETDVDKWESDGDFDSDKWTEKTYQVFSFSTAEAGGLKESKFWSMFGGNPFTEALKKFTDNHVNVTFSINNCIKQKIKQKVVLNPDKELTEREQWTTDASSVLIDLKTTLSGSPKKGLTNDSKPEDVVAQMANMFSEARESTKAKRPFGDKAFVVAIPILGTPIVGFVRIAPTTTFEYGIYGELQAEIQLSTTESYCKMIGKKDVTPEDKKTPIKRSKPKFIMRKAAAGGYLKLGGGFEVVVGAGTGAGNNVIGLGIGAEVSAILTVNLGIDAYGSFLDECYVKTELKATIIGRILFGWKSWRTDFLEIPIDENKFIVWPTCGDGNSAMLTETESSAELFGQIYHTTVGDFTASYQIADVGVFGLVSPKKFTPAMRIYYNQKGESKMVEMEQTSGSGTFKKNTKYSFKAKVDDIRGYDNLRIYPGYIYDGKFKMFDKNKVTPAVKGIPKITAVKTVLTDRDFWMADEKNNDTYAFTLAHKFRLDNAAYIKKYWRDWQAEIRVYIDGEKNPSFTETLKLTDLIVESGIYVLYYDINCEVEEERRVDEPVPECPPLRAEIRFVSLQNTKDEVLEKNSFSFDFSTPTKKIGNCDDKFYF